MSYELIVLVYFLCRCLAALYIHDFWTWSPFGTFATHQSLALPRLRRWRHGERQRCPCLLQPRHSSDSSIKMKQPLKMWTSLTGRWVMSPMRGCVDDFRKEAMSWSSSMGMKVGCLDGSKASSHMSALATPRSKCSWQTRNWWTLYPTSSSMFPLYACDCW